MSESETNQKGKQRWLSWSIVLVLVGVALVLRWRYIQEISLSVDEFNTIWAARHVLVRGIPSFPSGNIYPHGFVFTYLTVPFALGEMNESVVRLPGLLVSLVTIPVAYWAGRRLFDERVGLIAAAALAVDPDCILWGGRARMYGLLQLLVILIIYFYYRGLAEDRARDRYLAMVLAVAAIFTHLEAAFLLPALGLATLVVFPWRRILRWDVILPFAFAAVGAGVFLLISKYGQPGHLETLQESRPYLDLAGDILSGPQIFAQVFIDFHRLPFTLLTILGLVFLFRPRFDQRSTLTYLYVVFFATLVPLLVLAGATWQNERYLFMLLPLLYYLGGESLVRLIGFVPALKRTQGWQPAILALVVALYIGLTGARHAYAQELGYDLAFRTLRDEWQPQVGERVVSVSPSACAVYFQDCDYFAIQHGYEEFVVHRPGDGVLADLWTATPVLTDTSKFVEMLASGPRVWFVTDSWRFQTRYDADFIQTVMDHMDLVYNERGVMIFRADGYASLPEPAIQRERRADFGEALALVGFGLSPGEPGPGDELEITLNWQALENAGVGYTTAVQLLAADGTGVSGIDESVLGGFYQPDFWPEGMTFVDRHTLTLPANLPPGRYRLDLGLYATDGLVDLLPVGDADRLPLALLTVGDVGPRPPPTTPTDFTFGNQINLDGYDLACDPQPPTCNLQLHWQATGPIDLDYTVFAHLVDSQGNILAQGDGHPGDAFFPTSTWLPGTTILSAHTLDLPADTISDDFTLVVGLYHQPTATRLQAVDAEGNPLGDAVELTTYSLGAESP